MRQMRITLWTGLIAGLGLLAGPAARADVVFSLTESIVTAPPGSVIIVRGTIENQRESPLYVNGLSTTLTEDYAADNVFDDFYAEGPGVLAPGEDWEGTVLRISIDSGTPLQTSLFAVDVLGGDHPYDFSGIGTFFFSVDDSSATSGTGPIVPEVVRPGVTAWPNPFRSRVSIQLSQARAGAVTIQVYDVNGRPIRTIFDRRLDAGNHTFEWDGRDDAGAERAGGIYFVRARTPERTLTARIVRLE